MFPASLSPHPTSPGPPSFRSAICLNPLRHSARDLSELGLGRMEKLGRPRPHTFPWSSVPSQAFCALLPFLQTLTDSRALLPPHVHSHGHVWCVGLQPLSLFLRLAMSLPLSALHTSSLFGASCVSGSTSFLAPGRGGEQARGLSQGIGGERGSGPWLPVPAIPRTGCVTTKQCLQPSGSASPSVKWTREQAMGRSQWLEGWHWAQSGCSVNTSHHY